MRGIQKSKLYNFWSN